MSSKGIRFLKLAEGFRGQAYVGKDENNKTIGYGHVILPGESFGTLTRSQATKLMKKDLKRFETALNKFLKSSNIHLKKHQYDALVPLMFNIGADMWVNGKNPQFTKLIKSGKYPKAKIRAQFGSYTGVRDKSGKLQRTESVWKRHMSEGLLFNTGKYKYYETSELNKMGYKFK